VALTLVAAMPGLTLANGVGDLYVASSAGVLEVHVKTSTVVSTIPIAPGPQSLAFTPDGHTLYVGTGGDHVTPIAIVTLDVGAALSMPGPVSALAFPAGHILVGAMPTRRTIAFMSVPAGTATESAQLPGNGNLLAADRREARVVVAEAGKSWLDVVDPGTSTLKKTTVAGEIRALAIDRDHGGALVATHNPDALIWVDLTSLASVWTVKLSATPTAIAPLASSYVVAAGTALFVVKAKAVSAFATARGAVTSLAASDEGAYVHAAESGAIEVFDAKGTLQRTLELTGDRSPISIAAVPAGSSLFLGLGAGSSPGAGASASMPGALVTEKPPTTSTMFDTARDLASSPPVQGAAAVGAVILVACWLLIRWSDRRAVKRR
jgi:DNA-binding beta-propeller fold protein YncE